MHANIGAKPEGRKMPENAEKCRKMPENSIKFKEYRKCHKMT
jgi:hypothetical protein